MTITTTHLKRAGALTLFAGFVYCNMAVMLLPLADRWFPESRPRLPLPGLVADAFYLFGVFSYYEYENQEVVIEMIPAGRVRAGRPTNWIRLKEREVRDLFPFSRGDRLRRLYSYNYFGSLGASQEMVDRKFKEIQRGLADKIKARHNAAHPEREIGKIRIVQLRWPRSERGYYVEMTQEQTSYYVWHEE